MNYFALFVSILMIVGGIGLVLWSSSRQFNRRNITGTEEFKSFTSMILNRFLDIFGRITGFLLAIAGFITAGGILIFRS